MSARLYGDSTLDVGEPDCTHCQEWEICPFHPAPVAAASAPKAPGAPIKAGHYPASRAYTLPSRPAAPLPVGARLLGLDDPEVLGAGTPPDLIYAVPGGGVMGVPQAASASTQTSATPKIDRTKQWRCKDGRVLLIAEMSDVHLCNTIRLCIRKYEENLEASWSAAASFDSDSMASYYACGAASDVSPSPSLPYLQAEAKRRGVSW